MNKNLLSFAIILLAGAIVFINLWKPSDDELTNGTSKDEYKDANVTESIPVSDSSTIQEGKLAPDFELKTTSGDTIRLSDYQGKKVILNFWATWCPPCKAEMPHMQKFYEESKEKGIEIIAVNLTNVDRGPDALDSFIKEYGLTFTIPLDQDGDIGTQYQAFTIPTSYIIDSNGIITKKIIGPMDESTMMNLTKNID